MRWLDLKSSTHRNHAKPDCYKFVLHFVQPFVLRTPKFHLGHL
jgi:hypothetical protein